MDELEKRRLEKHSERADAALQAVIDATSQIKGMSHMDIILAGLGLAVHAVNRSPDRERRVELRKLAVSAFLEMLDAVDTLTDNSHT